MCTPVFMTMYNITFDVPRLSTFVFKNSSEKNIFTIIFVVKSLKCLGWNNFGPALQTVAQHYFIIGPIYRTGDNHQIMLECWACV